GAVGAITAPPRSVTASCQVIATCPPAGTVTGQLTVSSQPFGDSANSAPGARIVARMSSDDQDSSSPNGSASNGWGTTGVPARIVSMGAASPANSTVRTTPMFAGSTELSVRVSVTSPGST